MVIRLPTSDKLSNYETKFIKVYEKQCLIFIVEPNSKQFAIRLKITPIFPCKFEIQNSPLVSIYLIHRTL